MRVIVTGDREWSNITAVRRVLAILYRQAPHTKLVHGACRGADTLAAQVWLDLTGNEWQVEAYPAAWSLHGPSAGPRRNRYMLKASFDCGSEDGDMPGCGIAFHHDLRQSKGTKDMVSVLLKHGLPVLHVTK